MWAELRTLMTALAIAFAALTVPAQPSSSGSCTTHNFEGSTYTVCAVDEVARLRLFWKDAEGRPYRTFSRVAEAVAEQGHSLNFAMNAGMYSDDFSPVGLYVENGAELQPLDTTRMEGRGLSVPNFYKQPNGVFFVGPAGAGIVSTELFASRPARALFATQSGPMLVIDSKLNPLFIPGSKDRTTRSGVGVCGNGAVRFAISEDPVNFHDFARLFRDHLKCRDALFLDGGRGAGIYDPVASRDDRSGHGGYGPIVGLVR